MIYLKLFLSFLQIGLFSIGGGYAAMPLIKEQVVDINPWLTSMQFADIMAIAEMTPGPIAINCATFVGYKQKGLAGAIAATLGVITPSFIIIYLIAVYLNNFLEITWIANAFRGIRLAIGIIIIDAAINMLKKMKKKALPRIIMGCAFVAMLLINIFAWNVSSVVLIIIAGVVNLAIFTVRDKMGLKGGEKK